MSPRKKAKRFQLFSYKGLLIIAAIIGGLALILIAQFGNGGQFLATRSPSPKPAPNLCGTVDSQYDSEIFYNYEAALKKANEKRDKDLAPIAILPDPFIFRGFSRSSITARRNAYKEAKLFFDDLCKTDNWPLTDDFRRSKLAVPDNNRCNKDDYLILDGACELKHERDVDLRGSVPIQPRNCNARVINPHFNDRKGWSQVKSSGIWSAAAKFSAECDCTFDCQRVIPIETTPPSPPTSCVPPVEITTTLNTSGVTAVIDSNTKLRAGFLTTKDAAVDKALAELAKCPGINTESLKCASDKNAEDNECQDSDNSITAKLIVDSVNCAKLHASPPSRRRRNWTTTAEDCRGQCDVTKVCVQRDLSDPFADNPFDQAAHSNPGQAVFNGAPIGSNPLDGGTSGLNLADDISGLGRDVTTAELSDGFGNPNPQPDSFVRRIINRFKPTGSTAGQYPTPFNEIYFSPGQPSESTDNPGFLDRVFRFFTF